MEEKLNKLLVPKWWNPLFWAAVILYPAGFVIVGFFAGLLTGILTGLDKGLEESGKLVRKAVSLL